MPFVNLWVPYKPMRDLISASESPAQWQFTDPPFWTGIWRFFWMVDAAPGTYTLRAAMSARTVDQLYNLTFVEGVSGVVSIPLFLLARLIVVRVWRDQARARAGDVAA